MKSITEQLDEHFGVGCWAKVPLGVVVDEGDFFIEGNGILTAVNVSVGYKATISVDYYRAKPKQSDKFWIAIPSGMISTCYRSSKAAQDEAVKLSNADDGSPFIVLESVGIASAPKAVEYEEL